MTDPNLPALPVATASLHLTRTKAGAVVRIRIVTPEAVYFRTYSVPAVTEEVIIRQAMRSVSVRAVWVQGCCNAKGHVADPWPLV